MVIWITFLNTYPQVNFYNTKLNNSPDYGSDLRPHYRLDYNLINKLNYSPKSWLKYSPDYRLNYRADYRLLCDFLMFVKKIKFEVRLFYLKKSMSIFSINNVNVMNQCKSLI